MIEQWPLTEELAKSTYKPTTKKTNSYKSHWISSKLRFHTNSRFPPPWRGKFNSFSLVANNLLYLFIPKDMMKRMMTAIHFGHAGRDAMLREAADVLWPKSHREIIEKASNCPECIKAGKSLKCLKNQKTSEPHLRPTNQTKKSRKILQAPFKMHRKERSTC